MWDACGLPPPTGINKITTRLATRDAQAPTRSLHQSSGSAVMSSSQACPIIQPFCACLSSRQCCLWYSTTGAAHVYYCSVGHVQLLLLLFLPCVNELTTIQLHPITVFPAPLSSPDIIRLLAAAATAAIAGRPTVVFPPAVPQSTQLRQKSHPQHDDTLWLSLVLENHLH